MIKNMPEEEQTILTAEGEAPEDYKKTIQELGPAYLEKVLSEELAKTDVKFEGGKEGLKALINAYQESIDQGNYFDRVDFDYRNNGDVIKKDGKCLYEFLSAELTKHQMLKVVRKDREAKEIHRKREEQAYNILTAMEQRQPGFDEYSRRKNEERGI